MVELPGGDIQAPDAWNITKGNRNVVVAVIDTGVDYNHQDLSANMRRNTADCNNNGIDDDGNGYIDDCYGIDTINLDSDPMDDNNHGTHVSGIIGAVGNNNVGVVGVNWDVSIMACKFLGPDGTGDIAGAIGCFDYVKTMKDRGVNIVATNNSWGSSSYSQSLFDAIDAQRQTGILCIAGAGNSGMNNDKFPSFYPASYNLPNIISVAATDRLDDRAYFSNYGKATVHLGAPGNEILSTTIGNTYSELSGTSMAAPHVTGVAALLKAQNNRRDWRAIKNLILTGGESISSLMSTISQKRLNVYGSMTCSSSIILSRLLPVDNTLYRAVGSAVNLSALHINCATPNGGVIVNVDPGGGIVTLKDDGLGNDQFAGDGVYSGQWTPTTDGIFTLTFPGGDVVTSLVGQLPPDPTYAWHTFYGGSGYDRGRNIATDGSGNIYITGDSYVSWNGPAGQLPLHAHSGGHDIYVLKLDSSGSYQWHTFYRWAGIWEATYGITTDRIGNVYVTAESDATWNGPDGENPLHGHSGNIDISVLKLDSSGAYQWHTFYGGSDRNDPRSIVIDGSGNVYITGYSLATWSGPAGQLPLHAHSGGSYYDIFVLKLDGSGSYQWHTFYGAAGGTSNAGFEIAPDGSGNLYITGPSNGAWNGPAGQLPLHGHSGNIDISVLKLDTSGAYQWHTFYGSSGDDQAFGLTTDENGKVYVVGFSDTSWNGPAGQPPLHVHSGGGPYGDILLLKLDSSGSYQWHTFYGSSDDDLGYGIATDRNGNVYVTGDSRASWNGPAGEPPLHPYGGPGNDLFVLKLDTSGAYRWHTFYGTSYGDYAMDIAADGSGNVYITGESWATWNGPAGQSPLHAYSGNPGISDLYVLKLVESSVCIEPFITSQPQSQTIQSGQTAILSVSAMGTTPLIYQWYQGLAGDTSAPVGTNFNTYTTPVLTQTTSYWVRISNDCGYSDSSGAIITVTGISVISPNGGESLTAGSTQTVRWSYSGNPGLQCKDRASQGRGSHDNPQLFHFDRERRKWFLQLVDSLKPGIRQ